MIKWCGIFDMENTVNTISVDDYSVDIRIPNLVWQDFKKTYEGTDKSKPLIVVF
jgi:hypothetical protein